MCCRPHEAANQAPVGRALAAGTRKEERSKRAMLHLGRGRAARHGPRVGRATQACAKLTAFALLDQSTCQHVEEWTPRLMQ